LDHVDVHVGVGVLDIGQVEQGLAVDQPAADRGNGRNQRAVGQFARRQQVMDGQSQGDVRASYSRRARAAVSLDDGAIEHDLALAEALHVDRRAQAAPDQATDLLLPTATDAAIPRDALRAGRRDHRVLAGDPALAAPL
jgi:hypothetical protein